ncbi:MAG: amidohydrolase family protein [Gammaproteobacteria bacterium]|nr:amidohydrolase family protein [Gammaproteobacteria bacterium]MBU0788492.1 amidohydrolase family protein [Gammaproteobacteria bacterium]MBU0815684.1 amidohydrolase family protein [Gammaproteobacteria bacterium]MBU1788108.1 amidohydrolase family protein [Gammaproteobacteria bacterium]
MPDTPELLIRNALVFDGSGAEPAIKDVAISAGNIRAIGQNIPQNARQTVDAGGLALMPGIIDSHTHFDAQITWDPYVRPSPALGVTTAVIGNCGFTIAPCKPADRDLTMRHLTQVEGMSIDALRQGIDWNFETFPQYLALLRHKGSAVNIAAYIGHSSVRTWVMGEDASQRAATSDEINQMAQIVRDAMSAGAVGFSSSTSPAHNGEGGLPMPSRLASDEEMMALVKAMGEQGKGVYMVTKGGQMPVSLLEDMAAQSRRPVMVAALLHNSTNPGAVFKDLDAIAEANARGRKLIGQVSCCPLTMDFSLASPYPVEGLQSWKPALGLSGDALRHVLADTGFRENVRKELATTATFRLFNNEWDKVHVVETALPANAGLEQRTVAELAHALGKDPLDFMLDLALAENLQTVFTAQLLNSDTDAVGRMLNHPHSLVSLSDAGAHLTFFNDAGFGLHLLGHWVREQGAMGLSDAVRRLTSQPASVFGMQGRGLIREGYAADLLMFDPAAVGRSPKRRVFDLPGGAARLTTDALGVHGVWVNGQQVADSQGLCARAPLCGQLLTAFDS